MGERTAESKGVQQPPEKIHAGRGIARWLVQSGIFVLVFASVLFLSAGGLDWAMAWVYVAVLAVDKVIAALVLVPRQPELLVDRARSEGPRDLDRVLAGIMALWGPVVTLVVAGLDYRLGWSSHLPVGVHIGAVAVAGLGSLLTIWAMASNRHFYGVVRIEREKGHKVATAGPYRFVRHPGYAGATLFQLATPLILGSLWALVPAVLTVCATAIRTAQEDRTLQEELPGYKEYAQRVRYRLAPGVW